MRLSFLSLTVAGALGALALGASASCASVSDEAGAGTGGSCVGPSCNPEDAGRDQIVADVPVPEAAPDAKPPTTHLLCGAGSCLPDDPNPLECSAIEGGADPGSDAAEASTPDGGADAAPEPPATLGCGVISTNGQPTSACQPAGSGEGGSPCVDGGDCAPGLACVSEGSTAACRPYCCAQATTCAAGAYCAERPLQGASGKTAIGVPVCVPADDCSLDDPYPCPTNKQCKCQAGTACAVVKDDGTTSCVPPGKGRAGEPCPCAAGFVCSKTTNACLKLCSTTSGTADCGTGKCLAVAGLPKGFGICGLGGLGDGG